MRQMIVLLVCLAFLGTAFAAVTTEYMGNDQDVWGQTIQRTWPGVVGSSGYHLLCWGNNENQQSYPGYLGVATKEGMTAGQWTAPGGATEARAVITPPARRGPHRTGIPAARVTFASHSTAAKRSSWALTC